jgi:hypothetical protein
LAEALIQKQGMAPVDDQTLRRELEGLSDANGIRLRDDVLDLAKTGPAWIARGLKQFAETLPVPPGRPPKLSAFQSREICKKLLDLQRQGVKLGHAKNRMVAQFDVSLVTINRAWRKRAKLLAKPTV